MKTRMGNTILGAMSVILLITGVGHADLSEGLVAYYPFNGNANDESGHGNNGTVCGATLTLDPLGNPDSAYSFDGVDDYIVVPDSDSLDLTTQGTLMAWVNVPSGAKDDLTAVVAKMIHSSGGGTSYGLLNRLVGYEPPGAVYQTILGYAHNGSSTISAYYFHDISDGKWHHLAFTWNVPEGKLYIDGQDATEFGYQGAGAMVSTFDLYIGRYFYTPDSHWYSWDGSIDEVRIYNRALSPDEINTLVNPPPLVEDFYLHGVAPDLTMNNSTPTGTTAKYKDSPSLRRTEFKEIGTWDYTAPLAMTLQSANNLRVWVGLKNSDDQGTYFDIRAQLLKKTNSNEILISSCETLDIQGVTRNPDKAKEVVLDFGAIPVTEFAAGDVLSLRILTKVTAVGGHSNAVGLRLYYDSISRPSGLRISSSQ